jgi:hypothetical protein
VHLGAEDTIVGVIVANGLHQHTGRDPHRRLLDQLEDESWASFGAPTGVCLSYPVVLTRGSLKP